MKKSYKKGERVIVLLEGNEYNGLYVRKAYLGYHMVKIQISCLPLFIVMAEDHQIRKMG